MSHGTLGYLHAGISYRTGVVKRRLREEEGQGTVEYVGLILLVSLLMVGMVIAMKSFNGRQGLELAEVIVEKIKDSVEKVTFR